LTLLVLGGFGFSVLNPATGKAVVEGFPPRERGMAMGIKQTGLTLGGLAGGGARAAAHRAGVELADRARAGGRSVARLGRARLDPLQPAPGRRVGAGARPAADRGARPVSPASAHPRRVVCRA